MTLLMSALTRCLTTLALGLAHPCSLAFLPNGKHQGTERPGTLSGVEDGGRICPPVSSVPAANAQRRRRLEPAPR